VRYHPVPLQPEAREVAFASRQLDDTALARWLRAQGVQRTDAGWSPRELALAAVYFSPELDSARAALQGARAAEITAGARPQPSAKVAIGAAQHRDPGKPSRWSESVGVGLPLEPSGVRGARIARARALTLAATLGVHDVASRVMFDTDTSALAALAAQEDAGFAGQERDTLAKVLELLRAQYGQGSLALADVARAQSDVRSAQTAAAQASVVLATTRSSLARTLGLPVEALRDLPLQADTVSDCVAFGTFGRDSLRTLALHRRYDVGRALALYSAAEDSVRLEVARQFPTVIIGPGIGWNQGLLAWSLGATLPAILLNHNRGPIAQAVAARSEEAVQFARVQQHVIQQVGGARAECAAARDQLAVARALVRDTERQRTLAEAAYRRGEVGESAVTFAQLAVIRARRAANAAATRTAIAGARLDRALGGWVSGPAPAPATLVVSPRSHEPQ